MRLTSIPSHVTTDQLVSACLASLPKIVGKDRALQLISKFDGIPDEKYRRVYLEALVEDVRRFATEGKFSVKTVERISDYKQLPVSPKDFLLDPYYLDLGNSVFPEVLREFEIMATGAYDEIILTGSIGTAKTTLALWLTAYQVYLVSLLRNPQRTFGLDRSSEILFVFQSLSMGKAKGLDYDRFRALIEGSQYFRDHFPFNKDKESTLEFPNRVEVRPIAGNATAAIGENVFGGIIDEVNFMAVVENSKQSIDGGTYNQALDLYNSIARRRKSRFMQGGKLAGLLCLVSSRRYPGQFTDQKELEAKTNPRIYVYDKKPWDIKPDSFTGETFWIFTGDDARKPRVLEEWEDFDETDPLYMEIPVEYRTEFEHDLYNALRDIAGVSTLALTPYMTNAEAITNCIGAKPSLLMRDSVDMVHTKAKADPEALEHLDQPRFVHMDLSLTGDSTGVVMGYISHFEQIERGDSVEVLPHINIDFVLEVTAPKNGEIEFHKIRTMIYNLRDKLGVNTRWCTFDSYQSRDSIQTMRQHGITTGTISMDTSINPYVILKQALYDGRVSIPDNPKLKKELMSLEYNAKKKKIDHPSTGSKDLADALAGVVYGLTTRRELWARHGISLTRIPEAAKGNTGPDQDSEAA